MTIMRFEIEGDKYVFDNERLMFSEAMVIQQQAGLTTGELSELGQKGDTLAIGVTLWMAMLRQRAQDQGIGVRKAADEWPFAEFDFDINSIKIVPEPENPTGGPTDGPEIPTSPGTSAPRPAATRSASRKSTTPRSSRTTSASAPGSGTS